MEFNGTTLVKDIINNQQDKSNLYLAGSTRYADEANKVFRSFAMENSEDFYTYIDWLGLARDPDLIVLSSTHHYYYDNDELKNGKNVVHLKPLNQISQLKGFLHNVFHVLPAGSIFIGCFIDSNKKQEGNLTNDPSNHNSSGRLDPFENGIASRNSFFNFIYNILDLKTNRSMTKLSVRLLLEDHGFKVLDMTELNGNTFFCTHKVPVSAE